MNLAARLLSEAETSMLRSSRVDQLLNEADESMRKAAKCEGLEATMFNCNLALLVALRAVVLEVQNLRLAVEAVTGAVVAAPIPGATPATPVEMKTVFDVILNDAGGNKIQVMKVVREVTGLALTEVKQLVENPPNSVKMGVSGDEAYRIKANLEEQGAIVELKSSEKIGEIGTATI
jgi:large subunit ribosomal protein L7/L12